MKSIEYVGSVLIVCFDAIELYLNVRKHQVVRRQLFQDPSGFELGQPEGAGGAEKCPAVLEEKGRQGLSVRCGQPHLKTCSL